jgi:hypothetical protein
MLVAVLGPDPLERWGKSSKSGYLVMSSWFTGDERFGSFTDINMLPKVLGGRVEENSGGGASAPRGRIDDCGGAGIGCSAGSGGGMT